MATRSIDLDPHRVAAVPSALAVRARSVTRRFGATTVLAGLDRAVEGEISVHPRRSVVFRDARLLPWATVLENVALGLPRRDALVLSRSALTEVGLAGHERAWPKTLSGGEAQRVALARALVREPGLLLLDEPFGALDALTRIRMHALLQQLCARHGPAVVLVTHDVDEAILLADRIVVLADGRFTSSRPVELPTPRLRGQPGFAVLRSALLAELGVDEHAEGSHRRTPTTPIEGASL